MKNILLNKCPSCLEGQIYCGILNVCEECKVCGFKLKKHDAGDGPAFFAMFFASFIVVFLALLIDNLFALSMWIHFVIWTPLIIFLSIYFLRTIKSFFLYKEYQHNINQYKGDE